MPPSRQHGEVAFHSIAAPSQLAHVETHIGSLKKLGIHAFAQDGVSVYFATIGRHFHVFAARTIEQSRVGAEGPVVEKLGSAFDAQDFGQFERNSARRTPPLLGATINGQLYAAPKLRLVMKLDEMLVQLAVVGLHGVDLFRQFYSVKRKFIFAKSHIDTVSWP